MTFFLFQLLDKVRRSALMPNPTAHTARTAAEIVMPSLILNDGKSVA